MTGVVLRGAKVMDGTGAPAVVGDVLIEQGRIAEVGRIPRTVGSASVDVDGLVLAPGFIDNHTHLDAQILWDPDLAPSSWHGVTTVVLGNCGFSLAPTPVAGRTTILRMLENVEGMSAEALSAGVTWGFESFAEYLDVVRTRQPQLNAAALIGHSAVRYAVMGDEATERQARPDEIAHMRRLVAAGIDAGAIGFSSSKSRTDTGVDGKPVPSQVADIDELTALAAVLGESGRGTVQLVIGSGYDHVEMSTAIAQASGRPVTWGAVLSGMFAPSEAQRVVDECVERSGGLVTPQMACRPIVQEVTLADPMVLSMVSESFREVLAVPRADRAALCRDSAWRDRVRAGMTDVWARRLADSTIAQSANASIVGASIGSVATQRGVDPLDLFIDVSLADDLGTRIQIVLLNDDEEEVARLLNDRRVLLGLSDAGAHMSQLCDANFSTYLLGHWVRERSALPLELAVWRLTGHPAAIFGIHDRGVISPGMAADLVAFDPATVDTLPAERVRDLPGGAERLVARSVGIEHVWVNGEPIRRDGLDVEDAYFGTMVAPF